MVHEEMHDDSGIFFKIIILFPLLVTVMIIFSTISGLQYYLLRVTSEYHFISFHYMILRDYIHLRVSSEYFSFGAHIMKLVSLL